MSIIVIGLGGSADAFAAIRRSDVDSAEKMAGPGIGEGSRGEAQDNPAQNGRTEHRTQAGRGAISAAFWRRAWHAPRSWACAG